MRMASSFFNLAKMSIILGRRTRSYCRNRGSTWKISSTWKNYLHPRRSCSSLHVLENDKNDRCVVKFQNLAKIIVDGLASGD